MTRKKIKNIIFDLGGVVINLNVQQTFINFAQLAKQPVEEIHKLVIEENYFPAYEKGLISSSQFREHLRKSIGKSFSDEQLDLAWNGMLLDIPRERMDLITELSQHYNLFVLSNTNEIHMHAFHQQMDEVVGLSHYRSLFKKIYYSYEINRKKPDVEIFQFVLDDSLLIAEETLFLEDTPENLHGAASLNIQTLAVERNRLNLELIKNELLA